MRPILLILIAGLVSAPALALDVVLERVAVSSGAAHVSDSLYSLRATLGEAGVVGAVGNTEYRLNGGFWGPRGGGSHPVSVEPEVTRFWNELRQNFPNPVRGSTTISYSVAHASRVRLAVYDVAGRRVATLVDQIQEPGPHRADWLGHDDAGSQVGRGVYFYRIRIGDWTASGKLLKID